VLMGTVYLTQFLTRLQYLQGMVGQKGLGQPPLIDPRVRIHR